MTIWNSIRKHNLLLRKRYVLAAVSGGADSVAMLLALKEVSSLLKTKLAVAHLNHRIRGKAADADAAFVKQLASALKLPFFGGEVDVPRLARQEGLSIEMAARRARYEFLAKTARKIKADAIATAHTADDQAETILLKLGRGAGPRGLSGISRETVMNGVPVIRPLLDVTRSEIEAFLRERKQKWREDKTNKDSSYLRNRVRHEILPLLESKLNPRIRETLVRTADIMCEEDRLLEGMARDALAGAVAKNSFALNAVKLGKHPLALRRRAMALWLGDNKVPPEAIDFDAIERLEKMAAQKKGSGEVDIARGWIVKRRYAMLEVGQDIRRSSDGQHEVAGVKLKIPGRTVLRRFGLVIVTSLKPGLVKQKNLRIGTFPAFASLQLPSFKHIRLSVRSWRPGDRMEPFGMKGSKKLQDIFVDEKLPADERKILPVFECNGRIIWIPGYRVARGCEVKNPGGISLQIRAEREGER